MVRVFNLPSMPFVETIDTDWIQKINIKGKAPAGASRFTIYLQNGTESEPNEIPFVVDFRFKYGPHSRRIVTNHKKDGAWQTEEGDDVDFPLSEDEDFKIKIIVDDDCFKVKVNGEELMTYDQRLDCRTINCLRIDNDVELYKVKLV